MSGSVRVSVIIPVRDRSGLLAGTLEGLARQDYRDFEAIVVDDGSSDRPEEVCAAWADRGPSVRVVRTEGVGAVAARAVGVEAAVGDILAFTDSDCVPEPGWLFGGVEAIDKGADVVQGVTLPAGPAGPLERSITHKGPEGLYATCNVFYRRHRFEAAGGFDGAAGTRWGFRAGRDGRALGFGEDTLLGWRVAREGRSVIAEDAVVRHAVIEHSIGELLWRGWMTGGFPALIREVPELRHTLLRQGVFLGYRRVPVYAVAVAGLMRRSLGRRVALVSLVWWAVSRARYLRRRAGTPSEQLAAVPVEMAIDAVTAAALLWGSARARTIVL